MPVWPTHVLQCDELNPFWCDVSYSRVVRRYDISSGVSYSFVWNKLLSSSVKRLNITFFRLISVPEIASNRYFRSEFSDSSAKSDSWRGCRYCLFRIAIRYENVRGKWRTRSSVLQNPAGRFSGAAGECSFLSICFLFVFSFEIVKKK